MRFKLIPPFLVIPVTLLLTGQAFSATYADANASLATGVHNGSGMAVSYTYNAADNGVSMETASAPSPTSPVSINGGAANTDSTTVTLDLSAANPGGTATRMRFSNDNITWSAWEPYSATRIWSLSAGGGVKRVYMQLGDSAGNIIGAYSSSIPLLQP